MDGMEYANQKTSEANDRPRWARGAKWEGWTDNGARGVYRRAGYASVVVTKCGYGGYSVYYGGCDMPMNTLSAALAIANIIAEDRGGWA